MASTHENVMKLKAEGLRRLVVWVAAIAVALAIGGGAVHLLRERQKSANMPGEDARKATPKVALVPGTRDSLSLPREVIDALGVQTEMAKPAIKPDPLRLSGSLFVDPNRLVDVHTRFAGEVVEIGKAVENGQERPLRLNDKVRKGQLLAVIWSKDVGEKKSDLVDALSKLWLDQATLERLKGLTPGVVPKRTVLEAERSHEADLISVERVRRTLRSWRISEEEITAVEAEAKRIHSGNNEVNDAVDKSWAEIDVWAPLDGVILEKNVVIGAIIDTDRDLFKIADLSRLGVLANVYEEDIPALEALPPEGWRWLINLKAEPGVPPIEGYFEIIGNVIDPNQHTGTVIGWVNNKDGLLRIGQFITATIELPPPEDQVCVPTVAVIDHGTYSTVLVADDAAARHVTQRKVAVARRGRDHVGIRARITAEEKELGIKPLQSGELVITAGNVELSGALENLQADLASD